MKLIVTAEQMRAVDRTAIRRYGLPGNVLMENAGASFVRLLSEGRERWEGVRVAVVSGKGNNGGDGFVIARHLSNRGAVVTVFAAGPSTGIKGDARKNLLTLRRMAKEPGSGLTIRHVSTLQSVKRVAKFDLIIDALLGTGFSGPVRGIERKLIQWMNNSRTVVVSVDIPSGVNGSDGSVEGEAVHASMTVTMGLAKSGLVTGDGKERAGEIRIADIGIPRALLEPGGNSLVAVETDDVRLSIPRRSPRAHKHSVGKVLVIAGSRRYTGAPFMCAQAALRTGAGSVILAAPASTHLLLSRKLTEAMVQPVDETEDGSIGVRAATAIRSHLDWADVVVIGPGLTRHPETQQLLVELIPDIRQPIVLDADALAVLTEKPAVMKKRKGGTVLTPHTGELAGLTGLQSTQIERTRIASAQEAARQYRSVLVLKGSPTVTAVPGGRTYLNTTGNPGMATAGSGDVLAGMIGGLIGQGASPEVAAWTGVYLHGFAGDLAMREFGERGFLALDIAQQIPHALKSVELSGSNSI